MDDGCLTEAQRLKLDILSDGIVVSSTAKKELDERREGRPLSPADFASTTGMILRLDDDVWVNAPIQAFNANFVRDTDLVLDVDVDGFVMGNADRSSRAGVWLPPSYHGRVDIEDRSINDFVFSHGDRVRLSPMRGCAMRCKFCNVPYEDPYDTKPLPSMIRAVRLALEDPLQPAHHVLISGGTPRVRDVPFLRSVYETVLAEFSGVDIDIMMVPLDDLLDVRRLKELGLHELSINIELMSDEAGAELMPQKHRYGNGHYLRQIAEAAEVLGAGRVRSMVMVGLEPPQETLNGVEAILRAGGVPVLSPFRPDPATPLRDRVPASSAELEQIFTAATELASGYGTVLGPDCPPCTHNTLTFVASGGRATYPYPEPVLV